MDPIDREHFELKIANTVVIAPAMAFVLFLDHSDPAGILDFYNRSMDAIGGLLTHYTAENMAGRSPMTGKAREIVPTWMAKPRTDKTYSIQFRGCDRAQGISPAELELDLRLRAPSKITDEKRLAVWKSRYESHGIRHALAPTVLRVALPIDHPLADGPKFADWVLGFQLVRSWPFLSGFAGYALNFYAETSSDALRRPMQNQLAVWSLRHAGFDWHQASTFATRLLRYQPDIVDILPLVKRANWLNLVADKSLSYLGGRDIVRERLGQGLLPHNLEYGMAIQAGSAPAIGDVERGDFLPGYRRVAAALRAVRIEDMDSTSTGFSEEGMDDWLNAFDHDYE